jgi:hypothetical protein
MHDTPYELRGHFTCRYKLFSGPNEIEQSYWLRAIKLDPWPLGWGSNEIEQSYWLRAIKLDPWPFKWGSKTRTWQIEAKPRGHNFWRENQSVQTQNKTKKKKKKKAQKESSWFGEPRVQGKVPLKDSICFKWVLIGS